MIIGSSHILFRANYHTALTVYKQESSNFPDLCQAWMNSTFSSKSTESKQLARQGIEYILPPKQTRRPLCLCFLCLHPFSILPDLPVCAVSPCAKYQLLHYVATKHSACFPEGGNFSDPVCADSPG